MKLIGTIEGVEIREQNDGSVAWLANALGRYDIPLLAGDVILSGSLAAMIPVKRGDRFRMQIGGIGDCSVRFE